MSHLNSLNALTGDFRRRATALVLLLACGAMALSANAPPGLAGDIDWSLTASISSKPSKLELSPVDRGSANELWVEVVSNSYGVTTGYVKALYDRGYDYGEVALLLEISSASNKKPADVVVLRKKGLGWGVIAKELGVHPSALKRAKGQESLFRRYVLADRLAGYYGMPDNKALLLMVEKGYDFDEIVLAVNLCAHSGAPLREVVSARLKSKKWKGVAEKFKLSPLKLSVPPKGFKEKKEKKEKAGAEEEAQGKGKDSKKGKKETGEKKGSAKKGARSSCPSSCPESCPARCR